MKKVIRNILVQLIFLTPLGLVFSAMQFESGKKGISLKLATNAPITAIVVKNPSLNLRFQWVLDGVVSIISAALLIRSQYGGDFGAMYSILALEYGLLCLVSALSPTFPWNKRIFLVTPFELLVLVTFFGVPYFYLNTN